MDEIVKDFLIESSENLDRLDQELVKLESEPSSTELLASIFRTIHTIKGSCGFLGFARLEKVAHAGESLLSMLRDGKLVLNAEITSGLLAMVDVVRRMLAEIQATERDGDNDYPELRQELKRLQSLGQSEAKAPAGPSFEVEELAGPSASEHPSGIRICEVPGAPAESLSASTPAATPPPSSKAEEASPTPPAETRGRESAVETIRVGVNLLDQLMNLVGELVLARNQLLQFSNATQDSGFHAVSQRMNLIGTELQEEVMKTRMQPIGNIWNKFPRTVRDLALGCGKEVRLEMEGQDTELDRTIIEAIKDPLTHLVRNSIDHGIETPALRQQKGKEACGCVMLRAFHEGGQVNIEITDDGAGLNVDRIRHKAIERGLITPQQAERMPEREIFNLIFLPGFSTAEKVTNVSGRGVGMDVVKTNVEKIGGTVDVQSAAGKGTTVRVKIPLTLAIIPALIVRCNGDRFAIPQVSLTELVRLESGKGIEMVHGSPVYRLRGRLLPLVYLSQTLAGRSEDNGAQDAVSKKELIDFAGARDKHYQWIMRLSPVLKGEATMTIEEAGAHTGCALGKWLYGKALKEHRGLSEIQTLEQTHRQFHECVREVVSAKARGDDQRAKLAFENVQNLSTRVIDLLTMLERKVIELQNVNIVVLQAEDRQFGLVVDEITDTQEIVVKPLGKQLKGIPAYSGATIMGDGRVALILDVLGLAQRAKVIAESHESKREERHSEVRQEGSAESQALLLAENGKEGHVAMPLALVARLEEFPATVVERAGDREVMQYRGQIIPLLRLSQIMPSAGERTEVEGSSIQVVVYCEGRRTVGLIVDRIVDIIEAHAAVETLAARPGVVGSFVAQQHVTELLDLPAIVRAGVPGLFDSAAGQSV